MIVEGNKLTPSEGYKYITNGEIWSTLVYLGKFDSADNWHDTNEEPPAEGEASGYTEEELSAMTNEELRTVCAELGISGSMTKANMISLILDKQRGV